MIESKKVYKFENWCAGVGCPLKEICGHHQAPKEESRYLIRAPYQRKLGKFAKCDNYELGQTIIRR